MSGLSFRSIAEKYDISVGTAYNYFHQVAVALPHCADVSREYATQYCGMLLVDGKYIRVKQYERKIPVLYGIDYLTHDIPTFVLSKAENYQTCKKYFTNLRLLNYPLQTLTSDDNRNIYESCVSVYPKAVTQLCLVHYLEHIRKTLDVRKTYEYQPFMQAVASLFAIKRTQADFIFRARGIWKK